jgi:hypothetical protein
MLVAASVLALSAAVVVYQRSRSDVKPLTPATPVTPAEPVTQGRSGPRVPELPGAAIQLPAAFLRLNAPEGAVASAEQFATTFLAGDLQQYFQQSISAGRSVTPALRARHRTADIPALDASITAEDIAKISSSTWASGLGRVQKVMWEEATLRRGRNMESRAGMTVLAAGTVLRNRSHVQGATDNDAVQLIVPAELDTGQSIGLRFFFVRDTKQDVWHPHTIFFEIPTGVVLTPPTF